MAISRDHILKEVRRTATDNGGKPLGRLAFYTQTGIKEADWRGRYWARWNDVLRDAGYGPNSLVKAREDQILLDRLAALAIELGRIPVASEMRLKKRTDASFPNDKTYGRFGSKVQLLQKLRAYAAGHAKYQPVVAMVAALGYEAEPVSDAEADAATVATDIGTVYLLRSGRFYKIGRSNAAGRREREIALQLPEKASMGHVIRTDDPPGIEAYWHQRFADRRKNGEWFELTAADISAFRRRKFM
jgi:hypothetical protein